MSRSCYPVAAVAAVSLCVSAIAANAAPSGTGSSVLDRQGTLVTNFPPRYARFLHEARFAHVFLLGSRSGQDYYRLIKPARTCYGVGLTRLHHPGQIECWKTEPPQLLDFSIVEAVRASPRRLHLWHLQGMAHDGVVAIGMIDTSGTLRGKAQVTDGIYFLPTPPQMPIGKLVAYNSAGRVVATHSF